MNKIIRQRIAEEITTEIDNINVIIMDESFNMQFDKLYFAYVLLQRYQREVSRLILQEKVTELKERFRVILNKTIEGLKNEKSKKSSRTIFEQSQLIFNYV